MKISIILAHPDKNSFNHAIAAAAAETLNQNGHTVTFHDLYEERFYAVRLQAATQYLLKFPKPKASLLSIPTGGVNRRRF